MAALYEQLKADLDYLQAPRAAECFAALGDEAKAGGWSHVEYLAKVVAEQAAATIDRRLAARLRYARFPSHRTIEEFDFNFQPSIDRKLVEDLTALRFVEETSDPASAARLSAMQAQLADLDQRIANLVDAVETGADPGPILRQLAQRTAERDALAVRMATAARPCTLSVTQIEAKTAELGGIVENLQHATTEERAAIYASLDIRLEYDDRSHQVRATSNLARVANRVGGGT